MEDIIKDGNYTGVTAEAVDSKYAPYIELGACKQHPDKPAILFSYRPTEGDWLDWLAETGNQDLTIPVQVLLTRGDQSATVTINMIYTDSLIEL